MEEFPSNSQKQKREAKPPKEEPKKVEKVIEGVAIRRKKSPGKRFRETFNGANTKDVLDYVWFDITVPALQDLFYEAFTEGMHRKVFGESNRGRRSGGRPSGGGLGHVAYQNAFRGGPPGRPEPRREISRRGRSTFNFDEIILPTRVEADAVLDGLYHILERYEVATVADLYELCDIAGYPTDEKYGWTDIRGSSIQRVRNGYLIDIPKPIELD